MLAPGENTPDVAIAVDSIGNNSQTYIFDGAANPRCGGLRRPGSISRNACCTAKNLWIEIIV